MPRRGNSNSRGADYVGDEMVGGERDLKQTCHGKKESEVSEAMRDSLSTLMHLELFSGLEGWRPFRSWHSAPSLSCLACPLSKTPATRFLDSSQPTRPLELISPQAASSILRLGRASVCERPQVVCQVVMNGGVPGADITFEPGLWGPTDSAA
eukprot:747424-Hanusia_phi.AAC.1